ncbi:SEC-C metal-binding domain-containing protein [Rhodanobacter sp. DHG33]|uniref:SEC-C metal-binding domain-containing protein n=1 Tax=Rhodanobacter sp. DHG33 TaxID=2775921 RepID=UPI00177FC65D|nr:SEC-C metal-binding domain-containing protein [Rhodanobacter sp. DHG33]MBD8900367.1 SEC-C domain-containing protein [Rhodanobacter sp. DHG33]
MGSTTLRIPDALKAEADAYAASLGLSLNALCAVALRDYLDARRRGAEPQPGPAPEPDRQPSKPAQVAKAVAVPSARPVRYVEPAQGVYAPCPCGSGKKWKWCHGAS